MRTTPFVPTGSQLYGHIVSALGLHASAPASLKPLFNRTTRRYLSEGRRIRHPCVPMSLINLMLIGAPPCSCRIRHEDVFVPGLLARPIPHEVPRGLLALVEHVHVIAWDTRIADEARADTILLRAFARFATLDLAVKAAHVRLAEGAMAEDASGPPPWVDECRRGELVRAILDEARPGVGREQIAEELRVEPATITNWLRQGVRPQDENLRDLAALLGGVNLDAWLTRLRRHYALASLADLAAAAFGRAFAEELAQVYEAAAKCRRRTLVAAGYGRRNELAPFEALFIALSSWFLPPEVYLHVADHHAAPDWVPDVRRSLELWQLPGRSSDAREHLVQTLLSLHDLHETAHPQRLQLA